VTVAPRTASAHIDAPEGLIPDALSPVIDALCKVGIDLSRTIARGPLGGALGAEVGENTDGDHQKALDVMANDAFAAALKGTGVRWYASEEQDSVVALDEGGSLALAIDPLDGSSNIDVNVSIGTIFSILPAEDEAEPSFLRPGRDQIAAGYIVYGPHTGLIVTFGAGVREFVLDRDKERFVPVEDAVSVPREAKEFSINASNMRHWRKPVLDYVQECLAGETGALGVNCNMRWVGSLVAEAHRILARGGIFLYPGDARPGYETGRLRMVYECAPMAMLIEQAGGEATTGTERVLDVVPDRLHARVPLIFGSAAMVERLRACHARDGAPA